MQCLAETPEAAAFPARDSRFADRAPRDVQPLGPTLRPLRLCGAPLPSLQISRKANKKLIGTPHD